jgi:hypothetical protein
VWRQACEGESYGAFIGRHIHVVVPAQRRVDETEGRRALS